MSEVVVRMSSEDAQLFSAVQRQVRGFQQLEQGTRKAGQASREAAKENEALERAAKRVYEQTRTPQEQHIERTRKLNELLQKGRIDQETYGRAVKQSEEQLRRAGDAGLAAFGRNALAQVTGLATGFVSLSAVIGAVTEKYREMERVRDEAGARAREAVNSRGKLTQLAVLDPGKYKQLTDVGRRLMTLGGAADINEANATAFALDSASQLTSENVELIAGLRKGGVIERPQQLIDAAATLQNAMGEQETGSMRALLSKIFAASTKTKASGEALSLAASEAAPGAAALELHDEELIAAVAMVSRATKSPEKAGTQVAALMRVLQKKGIKGDSLLAMLETVEAKKMRGPRLLEYFGEQTALDAYRNILGQREQYAETLGMIEKAQREDAVGRMMRTYQADVVQDTAVAANTAKARHDMATEHVAPWQNVLEAMKHDYESARWDPRIGEEGARRQRESGISEMAFWEAAKGRTWKHWDDPTGERIVREAVKWRTFVTDETEAAGRRAVTEADAKAAATNATAEAATKLSQAAKDLKEAAETFKNRRPNTQQHSE